MSNTPNQSSQNLPKLIEQVAAKRGWVSATVSTQRAMLPSDFLNRFGCDS